MIDHKSSPHDRARVVYINERSVPILIPGTIAGHIPADVLSKYEEAAENFLDAKGIGDNDQRGEED